VHQLDHHDGFSEKWMLNSGQSENNNNIRMTWGYLRYCLFGVARRCTRSEVTWIELRQEPAGKGWVLWAICCCAGWRCAVRIGSTSYGCFSWSALRNSSSKAESSRGKQSECHKISWTLDTLDIMACSHTNVRLSDGYQGLCKCR
jgi:hypothetical protein